MLSGGGGKSQQADVASATQNGAPRHVMGGSRPAAQSRLHRRVPYATEPLPNRESDTPATLVMFSGATQRDADLAHSAMTAALLPVGQNSATLWTQVPFVILRDGFVRATLEQTCQFFGNAHAIAQQRPPVQSARTRHRC